MLVKVGVSNRHIHLNQEDYNLLFSSSKFDKRNTSGLAGGISFQAVEKVLPAKGFGGKDSWKGNRQGSLSLKSTTF